MNLEMIEILKKVKNRYWFRKSDDMIDSVIKTLEAKLAEKEWQKIETVYLVWRTEWQETPLVMNVWADRDKAIKEMELLQAEDTECIYLYCLDERKVHGLSPTPPTQENQK